MIPVFETERLQMRELVPTDFERMYALCGDSSVMKFVGNLKPYSAPQTRQAILKCLRSYGQYGYGGCALQLKEEQGVDLISGTQTAPTFVAYAGFEYVRRRAMAELFYLFLPEYWGKGLASEFAIAAVKFGYRELGMERIGASFDPNNHASMRVANKAGLSFSHEGLDEFKLPAIYYEGRRRV